MNKDRENYQQLAAKHPILNWFINNSVAANLLMLAILLIGLYMIGFFGLFGQTSKLRLESFPSQESRVIRITAGVNGSSPEDIEQGVTNKIEKALQGVQGIEKTTSLTSANESIIQVTAINKYNMDKLLDEVKAQVDSVKNLPAEVENVLVTRTAWQPSVLWATIYGDVSEKRLKEEATRLKNRLLQSDFIEKVEMSGVKPNEISIEISEKALQTNDLSLAEVANAININSINLSVGTLQTSKGNVALSIKSQANNQLDYENLIIKTNADGSALYLKDIATVTDGLAERQSYAGFNGQPSITLRLKSGKNANVIEADKAATKIISEFSQTLPGNLSVTAWNNRVSFVKDRIDLFVKNSITGVILVFLLLTLFLNIRLAFWVALGIPISFTGALILMKYFDISISLISLFGFILVLGIVVDDAIVIGESIYSWKKRTNNAPYATLKGTARVSVAATFGVLTTVAAFLPLTQIDSDIGNILGQIGSVVIFCLLFSLVESKLILPAHLYPIQVIADKNQTQNTWARLQASVAHGLELLVEKTYLPVVTTALRYRYFTFLLFCSFFVLSIGTLIGGIVPVSIMPYVESQSISARVEMDKNTSVSETIRLTKKVAADLAIADKQLMKKYQQNSKNISHISAFNYDDTTFVIQAGLASSDNRLAPSIITKQWRKVVGDIPGAKAINFTARQRFAGSDIELQVLSGNTQAQQEAGKKLAKLLKGIEGVIDVSNSQDNTGSEIIITPKPEAITYGITKAQLAKVIRAAFYGVEAERLQRQGEEVRVVVRYPKQERESLSDLRNLRIKTQNNTTVPLLAVADIDFAQAQKSIVHINGQRTVNINANIDKDKTSTETVIKVITEKILPEIKQQYPVEIQFGGEAEEDEKATKSMQLGFVVSLVLIYVLLAIPLKSYSKPIIIMSAIPFGIIGAIMGHLLLGMTLSILSMFGIIALSGVVVNDSLLLLSTIQQHRNEGMTVHKAIIMTGVRRFRPVILTSITTFVGIMPMLFETSFQAQFLIPMAVSLGFGILFATAITLILIPIVYAIFEDIFHLFFTEAKTKEV